MSAHGLRARKATWLPWHTALGVLVVLVHIAIKIWENVRINCVGNRRFSIRTGNLNATICRFELQFCNGYVTRFQKREQIGRRLFWVSSRSKCLQPCHDSGETDQFKAPLTTLKRALSWDVSVSKFTRTSTMRCDFVDNARKETTVFTY